ncbi:uncharacterized protein LOC142317483 [Lycorma delicatula]|uniref:uncharacterized protein LOC142317483 n=1 Tax=Lycorma delicatula TaxID=130591 RepID=UPI003F512941
MNIGLEHGNVENTRTLRVLQTNVNRSRLSHDLVSRLIVEKNVDFLIVTEPNIYEAARTGWHTDTAGNVAIKDVSHKIAWKLIFRGKGVVAAETLSATIVGVYISPNVDNVITNSDKKIIMLGDFNSRLVAAGGRSTNRRGEMLMELMETVGCQCINDDTPTFEARGHTSVSILDLTILDDRWRRQQWSWQVLQQDIACDYYATMVTLKDISFNSYDRETVPRFTAEQIEAITGKVAIRLAAIEQLTPETLANIIKQEMYREKHNGVRKRMVYWWTGEIAYLRQILQNKRRIKQRLRIIASN